MKELKAILDWCKLRVVLKSKTTLSNTSICIPKDLRPSVVSEIECEFCIEYYHGEYVTLESKTWTAISQIITQEQLSKSSCATLQPLVIPLWFRCPDLCHRNVFTRAERNLFNNETSAIFKEKHYSSTATLTWHALEIRSCLGLYLLLTVTTSFLFMTRIWYTSHCLQRYLR